MRIAPTAFLLAGCLYALAVPLPHRGPDTDTIDAWFGRIVQEQGFSGVVLIARGGAVLLNEGYGLADDETGTPMTAETVMLTGSISKQFTAAAVLILEERGLLRVDDPISEYLDGVPADKAAVTIHQLLTHTAGFTRDHFQHDLTPMDLDEALAAIYGMPLGFAPGTEYDYSNTGYALLAAIVQAVSDRPFTEFMHEEIFEPAGLSSTGFFGDDWSDDDVAVTYFNGRWQGRPSNFPGPFWGNMGNAGVMSTTADLYRWISALRAGKTLNPENVDRLFEPYVTVRDRMRYGYGWFITDNTELGPEIGHGGVGIGGNSEMAFYPDRDLTIIILSNHATYRAEGGVAIEASLPAREARNRLRSNIATGDFSLLPAQTRVRRRPTNAVAYALLGLAAIVALAVWHRRGFLSPRER
jgi:CubicO group peptidase (beta-lactamase class C family)